MGTTSFGISYLTDKKNKDMLSISYGERLNKPGDAFALLGERHFLQPV
jgi:hypothetical protein